MRYNSKHLGTPNLGFRSPMFSAKSWLALLMFSTCVFGTSNTTLADDLVKSFEGAVDCSGCHALLLPLQFLAQLGDSVFTNTIIAICATLRVSAVFRTTMDLPDILAW